MAATLALLVACGAPSGDLKSVQQLSSEEKEMVRGLLHEALERTFSDYQAGKIYQAATIHRHPRDSDQVLNPPIEGLAVVIGMFSPKYSEDDIKGRIEEHLATLRVSPKDGGLAISVNDYVVEFLHFGMGGQVQLTVIPLSIEVRQARPPAE